MWTPSWASSFNVMLNNSSVTVLLCNVCQVRWKMSSGPETTSRGAFQPVSNEDLHIMSSSAYLGPHSYCVLKICFLLIQVNEWCNYTLLLLHYPLLWPVLCLHHVLFLFYTCIKYHRGNILNYFLLQYIINAQEPSIKMILKHADTLTELTPLHVALTEVSTLWLLAVLLIKWERIKWKEPTCAKEEKLTKRKWWTEWKVVSFLKVKLSAKCNLGFFCQCTRVKPSYKSIITMKEALLRFTVFSFLCQTHFQWECYGHFSDSIKISIFKTLRRLDTTWNFARSITRVSTHQHEHWEHCLCTQSLLKRTFFNKSP